MLLFSTKTQKERKGLGTSPFGALRLTPYPHPLRFCDFPGKPHEDGMGKPPITQIGAD